MRSNRHGTRSWSTSTALGLAVTASLAVTSPGASAAGRAAPASARPDTVAAGVPSAAPVGRLAPSGCTHDSAAGTDLCDLYAMTGTTQVLGHEIPIWGFATTSAAGSATAPGPVLVVPRGDKVTFRLHNQLSEPVSLAFPGQPAGAFTEGLGTSTSGAAQGATQDYTFTADRAGTFLYEAGHTPGGARQVAMGLAGALVVTDGSGAEGGVAYDDEAVMVLSEIDPRLNAAPSSFDMRDYRARYRLLNGRPFPSTSVVATDQGHQVLLRYVNAGSSSHAMSLLGATQRQLSDDGHLLGDPAREIVATLAAGTTADTVVTMPTGPETKVTLYEAGQHLNNDGQTELDPTRVATGGMLAFLDTNAPPSLDDRTGPVSSHVAVSPNPSDGKADVTVTADLSDARSGGSKVVAAEYTVDDPDVGVGNGIPLDGPGLQAGGAVTVTGATATIPAVPSGTNTCDQQPLTLSCLPAGKHVVYVRGKDAADNWGAVGSAVLNLPKTGPGTTNGTVAHAVTNGSAPLSVSATGDDSAADGVITGAEVFLDEAGADGTGVAMALNRSATIVSEDLDVPTTPPGTTACAAGDLVLSCLTEGKHDLLVHSKDSLGLWGPVLDVPFTLDRTGPNVDAAAVSPNPSNGAISSAGNTGYLRVSALVTDRDPSGAPQSRLTGVEGFFAPSTSSPKPGTGFQFLAVDGKYDATSEQTYGLIPLSQVKAKANGSYQVYVRGRDEAGNWGELFAMPLVVDKTAPVLASVTGSPNPTNGAALLTLTAPVTQDTAFQTAEFWTGTTDPGVGKATRVSVSWVGGAAVATVPTAAITPGNVRFNLRVQDMAGNWSNAVSTTVTVSRPNAIFSDTFDSGSLSSWSARTNVGAGSMTVSPAAGIPSGGANQGLSLTGPGTHYVTDNSPAAETGYHASFAFSAGGFTSGTSAAVTLFDGRTANTGGGGPVFSLDYRKSGGTNQVRVVMTRVGQPTSTGSWVNLAAGTHVLRLDWVSGPATGGAQGTLKLSVDGAAVSTLTGNSSTLRLESVRLGLVSGTSASSVGTASVDSFQSTRTTLP